MGIVFAIVGGFVAVILVLAIIENKKTGEQVAELSDEQKEFLMSTEVKFVEKNAWIQDAIVAVVKEKNSKVSIRLFWYNNVIQNAEYHTITIADTSIKKAEQEEHKLKVGDKVKMYFAPEKTIGSVKIIWE